MKINKKFCRARIYEICHRWQQKKKKKISFHYLTLNVFIIIIIIIIFCNKNGFIMSNDWT